VKNKFSISLQVLKASKKQNISPIARQTNTEGNSQTLTNKLKCNITEGDRQTLTNKLRKYGTFNPSKRPPITATKMENENYEKFFQENFTNVGRLAEEECNKIVVEAEVHQPSKIAKAAGSHREEETPPKTASTSTSSQPTEYPKASNEIANEAEVHQPPVLTPSQPIDQTKANKPRNTFLAPAIAKHTRYKTRIFINTALKKHEQ